MTPFRPVVTWDTPSLKISAGDCWLSIQHHGFRSVFRGTPQIAQVADALREALVAHQAREHHSVRLPDGQTVLCNHGCDLFFEKTHGASIEPELAVDLLAWVAHISGGDEKPDGDLEDLRLFVHGHDGILKVNGWSLMLTANHVSGLQRMASEAAGAGQGGNPRTELPLGNRRQIAIERRTAVRSCLIIESNGKEQRLWVTRSGLGRLASGMARAAAALRHGMPFAVQTVAQVSCGC